MSYCSNEVLALASGIYADINSPSSQTPAYIAGVLTSSGFLGDMNNKLTTSFYVLSGSCIEGGFGPEEAAIASLSYQTTYLRKQQLALLQGVAGAGGVAFWTTIQEADTRITRESTANLAKVYGEMYRDVMKDMNIAVANWKVAHCQPISVDYASLASRPTP